MRKPLLLFRVLGAAALAAFGSSAPAGAAPTAAQDQAASQDAAQVTEFADQYNQRYAGQEPREGATLPNVKLYDAEGNPFELASTRGKYTVLVFGCLT